MKESRNEKFRRISEKRMSRVFKNMNLLANLSNKHRYDFSVDEIEEMFEVYFDKGKEIKSYFGDDRPVNKPTISSFIFSNKPIEDCERNLKFRNIAEKRLSRILNDMNLIANLSVKNHYQYNEGEVEELFNAYYVKGIGIKEFFILEEEFKFKK